MAAATSEGSPAYNLVLKESLIGKGELGDCPFCHRVLLFLEAKGTPAYSRTYVDLRDKPEWLLKASDGKVPVLRNDSLGDMVMPDSDKIVEYLEKEFPEPSMASDVPPEVGAALMPSFRGFLMSSKDSQEEKDKKAALIEQLEGMEKALSSRAGPFFGGATMNTTDASLAPKLYHAKVALKHYKGFDFPSTLPSIEKYLDALKSYPPWIATDYGEPAILAGWKRHMDQGH